MIHFGSIFRALALVGWAAFLCASVGCHSGFHPPPGWTEQMPLNTEFASDYVTESKGQLQVIICYGHLLSNHAALRLTCPGQKTVFWDPGGTYGEENPLLGRKRDLILTQPPTLEQWWDYRRHGCNEPFMAVFEWDLNFEFANDLQVTLIKGINDHVPGRLFNSDAPGLFCSIAVCDFLKRFAQPRVVIEHKRLLPHQLADDLWTQSPDRVRLFRKGKPAQIFVRGGIAVADATGQVPSGLTPHSIR